MKLKTLIKNLEALKLININLNVNITALCNNHTNAEKGCMFFCIKGYLVNGENFAQTAVNNGAKVVVTETELPNNIPQIVVKNVRLFMALAAKNFYNSACDKLKIIGITGTNGKTTTAHIISSVMLAANIKCGIIGTNGAEVCGVKLNSKLTTPDPINLHKLFFEMKKMGAKFVVMEVSAHAIYLEKISGIKFSAVIFSNITEEHLDFFGDMQNYINTKLKLINNSVTNFVILNADCENLVNNLATINVPHTYYGIYNPSDTFAINIYSNINGCRFVVNCNDEIYEINSNLFGKYNVYNILSAIAALKHFNVKWEHILLGLKKVSVGGRQEVINYGTNKIIIDYAHTPDGIEKIISAVKPAVKGKIITMFGCVGYSNLKKRQDMLTVACVNSDLVVFTTDNPHEVKFSEYEKELSGIANKFNNVTFIENRFSALKFAIENLHTNDVLLALGKGNESTQVVNGVEEKYNEKESALKILNKIN